MPRFSLDGRLIAFGMVGGYFLFVVLAMLVLHTSLSSVLNEAGVPPLNPHFGDLRNVVAGIENKDTGYAVGDPNSFDPWKRPYIYPSIWLHAKILGFNRETVVGFGIAIILLFYASVYSLLGKLTVGEGFFTGLFLISPALMTGIERCNIDLVIFPLILATLALRRKPAASGALIILVTLLKIHPIGALLAFFAPPWKKTLPWLGGILGVLFIYVLINWHELTAISTHAPRYAFYTFGSSVWGNWLYYANVLAGHHDTFPSFALGTLVFVAVGYAFARLSPKLTPQPRWEWEIYSFRLGAGLYLALFALGSSNDYGMLFLLFCLPLLFRLMTVDECSIRWWATVALGTSLTYVNWDLFSEEYLIRHMLLKQALSWIFMASLIVIVSAIRTWPWIQIPDKK